jgi:hypothetical protein
MNLSRLEPLLCLKYTYEEGLMRLMRFILYQIFSKKSETITIAAPAAVASFLYLQGNK